VIRVTMSTRVMVVLFAGTFLYMKGCLTPFLPFVRPVLTFEHLP
jgi:hypothetical protein